MLRLIGIIGLLILVHHNLFVSVIAPWQFIMQWRLWYAGNDGHFIWSKINIQRHFCTKLRALSGFVLFLFFNVSEFYSVDSFQTFYIFSAMT